MIKRRKAKVIQIGKVRIGGNYPIAIQSMAKCKTSDSLQAIRQIKQLEAMGCEIVRLAVKDQADAAAIRQIKRQVKAPLVADIHFDWRLALAAIDSGADKIRLNPGNIFKPEQIKEVARAARLAGIPIRVGLNSGSVKKSKGRDIPSAMCVSALEYIRLLEKCGFYDIVVSLKASNIMDTVAAYRKFVKLCQYPLHLGVTATGLPYSGAIKSSIAVGALLLEGIGDTVRISLTDTPEQEIKAAKAILEGLGLRHFGPEVISCPTCGRCEVDLIKIVKQIEDRISHIGYQVSDMPAKLAVMGCVVNGPGEAREADIGIAFGKNQGLMFKAGKPVRKVSLAGSVSALIKEMGAKRGRKLER